MLKMPLDYRINQFLSSRLGRFRTGDRVAVTGSWLGDYTGTVKHSVYQSVTVIPDPGTSRRVHTFLTHEVRLSDEPKSHCVRIWDGESR
ncbi:hypothetical protein ACFV0B_02550 [Streptomyces xanthophaeus]|uniref:hypothetical protein n=1 Tax=Streptomyces xanthophaeus TaxID=67385 RepID=UPI0036825987